jgi:aryl-alcohol dehydrogenase-like predicted oxidoreductase
VIAVAKIRIGTAGAGGAYGPVGAGEVEGLLDQAFVSVGPKGRVSLDLSRSYGTALQNFGAAVGKLSGDRRNRLDLTIKLGKHYGDAGIKMPGDRHTWEWRPDEMAEDLRFALAFFPPEFSPHENMRTDFGPNLTLYVHDHDKYLQGLPGDGGLQTVVSAHAWMCDLRKRGLISGTGFGLNDAGAGVAMLEHLERQSVNRNLLPDEILFAGNNLLNYSLYNTGLLTRAKNLGVTVVGASPFASGALNGKTVHRSDGTKFTHPDGRDFQLVNYSPFPPEDERRRMAELDRIREGLDARGFADADAMMRALALQWAAAPGYYNGHFENLHGPANADELLDTLRLLDLRLPKEVWRDVQQTVIDPNIPVTFVAGKPVIADDINLAAS